METEPAGSLAGADGCVLLEREKIFLMLDALLTSPEKAGRPCLAAESPSVSVSVSGVGGKWVE